MGHLVFVCEHTTATSYYATAITAHGAHPFGVPSLGIVRVAFRRPAPGRLRFVRGRGKGSLPLTFGTVDCRTERSANGSTPSCPIRRTRGTLTRVGWTFFGRLAPIGPVGFRRVDIRPYNTPVSERIRRYVPRSFNFAAARPHCRRQLTSRPQQHTSRRIVVDTKKNKTRFNSLYGRRTRAVHFANGRRPSQNPIAAPSITISWFAAHEAFRNRSRPAGRTDVCVSDKRSDNTARSTNERGGWLFEMPVNRLSGSPFTFFAAQSTVYLLI